jgi:dihydroorotate dehydrogenase (fumarate)
MANLETNYLGLNLKNPFIVGSSGLTSTPVQIKRYAEAGASAIVIKSIFEEEIQNEFEHTLATEHEGHHNDEFYDYFDYKIKEQSLEKYSKLIYTVKNETDLKVIASINAVSPSEWTSYAAKFEEAGADAIEINAFLLPTRINQTSEEIEKIYFDLIDHVLKYVEIPVSLKIGSYFSGMANIISRLSKTGIKGLTLFNRTFHPDIDIDEMKLAPAMIFSSDYEYLLPLRWIALMSGRINIDISASTGIHTSSEAIKMLLAGAKTVQVVSAIYKHGPSVLTKMIEDTEKWMESKNFSSIEDFRGLANNAKVHDPAFLERIQFMKYFGDREDIV